MIAFEDQVTHYLGLFSLLYFSEVVQFTQNHTTSVQHVIPCHVKVTALVVICNLQVNVILNVLFNDALNTFYLH